MSENNENLGKIEISRRDFMKLLGADSLFVGLGAIGIPSILKNINGVSAMTASAQGATTTNTTNATGASVVQTGGNSDIRPFSVNVPEAELTELRRRIVATKWPEKETVADFSQGIQLAFIQALARYWATDYDWRKVEAKLKALPQFITNIDGLDIHFIHVRSKHENALPLIVTHGWPGSIIEQLKIIDPLTNPTAHGASASDAFHVVIPSMAGYGFSGKPTTPGWDPARMARAWVELMKRLGYSRFAAQGGDWGAFVTNEMAQQAPPELIGIHLNFTGTAPSDVAKALQSGEPAPAGLSAEEQRAYNQLASAFRTLPTQQMMTAHPQTLYGLTDSPVALAAWLIDHDVASYGHIAKLFVDGEPYGDLTRDDILDNITHYWLTNTGVSSSRLYREYKGDYIQDLSISVPAAVSVFPEEIYQAPRSWTERAYHNLIHFNALAKGGHFAAWEQPQLFSEEVRAGLRSLRQ
jgi:pimeloyl-ACP methyl ester carboxylesterase